jgi:predicted transcriptional regulator YdeE
MEPRIVEKGAFKVAGLQTYGAAISPAFAQMWTLLMDGDLALPNRVGEHLAYGICSYVSTPETKSPPDAIAEQAETAYRTIASLMHSLGRQPTIEELATALQVDTTTAEQVLANLPQTFSLDDSECGIFYMASVEVDTFDNLPPTLVAKVIPTNTYAVFTYRGVLDSRLKEAFHAAYEWLAASDYERAGPYDFEFYGSEFTGPQNPESVLEIWVPIRKAS